MEQLPLEGLRVLDLGQVYAGPYAAKQLADMGAEVIKVESATRSGRGGYTPQRGAVYPEGDPGERPYNRLAYYNELNRNKLAISLDLSGDEGQGVFKRLVAISDVLIENFSPRVMTNFGLDYSILSRINAGIIMVSISAYGQTGPYRNHISYGRGVEAMSALSQMTSYEDSQPLGPGIAYADATAGSHAAFAVLAALRYRKRTGKGQHIDLSLRESLIPFIGEHILDYSMNTRAVGGRGNHDSHIALQGCCRCRADNTWITFAICSTQEWEAFCNVLGNPAWIDDERFADHLCRQRNQHELMRMIEEWTVEHDAEEAMHLLQGSGISAGPVLGAADLLHEAHLRERGFFAKVTHPEAGTHDHPTTPWKLSQTTRNIRFPAPCFAQHNAYVFGSLLGLSREEIDVLEKRGIAASNPGT